MLNQQHVDVKKLTCAPHPFLDRLYYYLQALLSPKPQWECYLSYSLGFELFVSAQS